MSFHIPPTGLDGAGGFARYEDVRPNDTWVLGDVTICDPEEPFADYVIFTPTSSSVPLAADPGSMEFFNSPVAPGGGFLDLDYADLYTLRVAMRGPDGLGFWHDPPICFPEPFDYETDGPTVDVTLDADVVDSDGNTLDSSPSAAGPSAFFVASIRGFLVNPAPVWPVPDSEGNTAGSILWTAAQIAEVTGEIAITRGPGTGANPGLLAVTVRPYRIVEPGFSSSALMCVL